MTNERPPSIPMGSYPDPVFRYVVEDDEPRIVATNDAFESAFPAVGIGDPVSTFFASFGVVEGINVNDPLAVIDHDESTGIHLAWHDHAGSYHARVVAPAEDGGFLVCTSLEEYPDVAGIAGGGAVASVISHDLRNPLDVAKAHLQAARETDEPEHFEAVSAAHDRMERIIHDVLTLARGPEALNLTPSVSIADAAESAWDSVDTFEATWELSDPIPSPRADPDHLRRLFENLFRNAVEHSEDPVTVQVGALDDGFYVADDGPGISADEQEVVRNPGYSTNDGTGLGLAIVDRIASAHGWHLTLATADSGGTRFEIRF